MSAREFESWLAYDLVSPIGGRRLDILCGLIRHTLIALKTPKGKQPPTLESLIPFTTRAVPTLDEVVSALMGKPPQ